MLGNFARKMNTQANTSVRVDLFPALVAFTSAMHARFHACMHQSWRTQRAWKISVCFPDRRQ